jgi:hypothetical protein
VTATLTYGLSTLVFRGNNAEEKISGQGIFQPGRAEDCANTGKPQTCIEFPDLVATAAQAPSVTPPGRGDGVPGSSR